MPAGLEVWQKLLALEKHRPLHFQYMLVEELSKTEEFSLQKWWDEHKSKVEEVLGSESDEARDVQLWPSRATQSTFERK